tara:strand:- start:320 stop:703 length:384 start_codon:yes stop_codon:yes gene_type:complete
MNKHMVLQNAAVSSGDSVTSIQIENGAEELQLKRIFMTSSSDGTDSGLYRIAFALADEAFTSVSDFIDSRIICQYIQGPGGSPFWNETQTIRVPRGMHLGLLIDGSANNVNPEEIWVNVQVNYLVLG